MRLPPLPSAHNPSLKLLLVEDDPATTGDLRRILETAGHAVDLVSDRCGGLMMPANDLYDALIVNATLLHLGRLAALGGALAADQPPPILYFGDIEDAGDRLTGVDLGGDDYVPSCAGIGSVMDCLHRFRQTALLKKRKRPGA